MTKNKQRLEIVRSQISDKRLSKKFKCESIDDAMNKFRLECKKKTSAYMYVTGRI